MRIVQRAKEDGIYLLNMKIMVLKEGFPIMGHI